MSWLSDGLSNYYSTIGKGLSWVARNNPIVPTPMRGENDVSKFIDNELTNKAELRSSEVLSFASGLPFIGNVIKGIEGINQLEDLYSNSGKVAKYPALQGSGASSIGRGLDGISRKIENGTHDLFEHYSGTKDDTIETLHEKGIIKYGDEI